MPLTPDLPFPKAAGHAIRSKDWNDAVTEVQRLDNAKVNRAGADAMAGPLTIAAALAVGTTNPAAGARLHVVDSATPAILRLQSTAAFGAGRLEMWSDPRGGPNEWRPGYIESIDQGTFTGGLAFFTNGSGAAAKTGSVEAMRLVNGKAGFGVTPDLYRVDVGDRIRLRQGPQGTAGLWLYSTGTNNDRAFVGLANDGVVGLWGNTGANWGLQMDTTSGNLGIRRVPLADYALAVTGNVFFSGRLVDQRLASEIDRTDQVSTTTVNPNWAAISFMSMTVNLTVPANVNIRFNMPGTQMTGVANGRARFRILVDGVQQAFMLHEFHNNGWELRNVVLERILLLSAGSHTIAVQWNVEGGTVTGCWYGDTRTLVAVEL